MEDEREALRAWIRSAVDKVGLTPTALAQRAGLAQSTITRFLNNPDAPMLGLRSIAKIAHAADMPQPFGGSAVVASSGVALSEAEARPFERAERSPASAFVAGRHATDPWVLQSDALDAAGYLPGDILIVALNETPRPGDVVCAQVYRWSEGRADTVFRIYEPPYLVADSCNAAYRKPFLVDDERVVIKGVVIASYRMRGAPA